MGSTAIALALVVASTAVSATAANQAITMDAQAQARLQHEIMASTNCDRRKQDAHAFVYVGADLDVFALHFLACAETRIFYIARRDSAGPFRD